ncbi:MAG: acetate/propionate family kinase [Ginsengibacter sp.]
MYKSQCILTINGGSSSIKFSLYKIEEPLTQLFYGAVDNIGTKNATFSFNNTLTGEKVTTDVEAADHERAALHLIDRLETHTGFDSIKAIGHRIVHGMKHTDPELITPQLLEELKKISAYDPEHLPLEIKLVELFSKRYPALKQVACFDTSFHTTMPQVAKMLSIPRRYYEAGIQRYGFHGLSYAYLLEELEQVAGSETAKGKIIMAHLGNGASLAAIKDGKSMDTSMGFTPASGIPMGTRSGDLDPGIAWYLMEIEKLSAKAFNHFINHESGLLGISATSADMRALSKVENTDNRAAEAIDLFCYQTKKWIGSFAAVLGGVDTLIFSGGIGEHSPEVRSKICDSLGFLGIELDEVRNRNNEVIISTDASKVPVHVIGTNEELMMARFVCNVLNYHTP